MKKFKPNKSFWDCFTIVLMIAIPSIFINSPQLEIMKVVSCSGFLILLKAGALELDDSFVEVDE